MTLPGGTNFITVADRVTAETEQRIRELEAECRAANALADLATAENTVLLEQNRVMWEAITDAMKNIGVPQPDYPAPVWGSYEILRQALAACDGVELFVPSENDGE